MNDRHPSGTATPPTPATDADYARYDYASYDGQSAQHGGYTGYDGYSTDTYSTGSYATDSYDTGTYTSPGFATDPLFGDISGGAYDSGQWSGLGAAAGTDGTGTYQTQTVTAQETLNYDPYAAQHHAVYETGSYDTTAVWASAGYEQLAAHIPAQATSPDADGTGQWDSTAWAVGGQTGQWETQATQTFTNGAFGDQSFDTGTYDATAWNSDGGSTSYEYEQHDSAEAGLVSEEDVRGHESDHGGDAGTDPDRDRDLPLDEAPSGEKAAEPPVRAVRSEGRVPRARSRRRSPAKRSALLTVAVPSACVMGVAGIAAASVSNMGGDDSTTAAASDTGSVKPSVANNKLDTQLQNLSADAGDFADRASRTQERIDLKAEQEAERKKAAEEAARKERLRPKFALPVTQHGLSAYFGQAGVNWMSVHTGIDFPVSYGTPVMAATDGTVRVQWNSAYGNMAIVTAKDGTETWYCHLSSHKISSGPVKAGEVIAYSGNSGNSTGPHLHFEVRPGGGAAIDPLPWLRSHDLNPT
ncbi:M23 family metallopeptidase [Streptomyces sp. NPDC002577]